MTMIRHFQRNATGRDLAVGDIHGCFSRRQAHLDTIGFNPACDRLFSVGDLVDRGPESDLALEWLDKPWFHAVRGNHEDMAIRWPRGNMDATNYTMNGGAWNVSNPPAVRQLFADYFSALPLALDVETSGGLVGIVHAECPFPSWQDFIEVLGTPELSNSLRKAIIEAALWSRERITAMEVESVAGVRAVVVGHTPVERFTSLGNTFYIDTGAVFRGRDFTILDLETLRPVDLGKRLEWEAA
ncbi:MAG: metallophosphoesterase [Pseudomonadota bacterium]